LSFSQDLPTRLEALICELQIKVWSRKKKEELIRGDWVEISRLAKSKACSGKFVKVYMSVHPELVEGLILVRQAHHERMTEVSLPNDERLTTNVK
jgi:hypothetical protein